MSLRAQRTEGAPVAVCVRHLQVQADGPTRSWRTGGGRDSDLPVALRWASAAPRPESRPRLLDVLTSARRPMPTNRAAIRDQRRRHGRSWTSSRSAPSPPPRRIREGPGPGGAGIQRRLLEGATAPEKEPGAGRSRPSTRRCTSPAAAHPGGDGVLRRCATRAGSLFFTTTPAPTRQDRRPGSRCTTRGR